MSQSEQRGVWLAIGLVSIGAAAALTSWWYNYAHSDQALAFWEPAAIAVIQDSPQVYAYQLSEGSSASNPRTLLSVDGTPVGERIEREVDASAAKGLIHLRHALVDDRSYVEGETSSVANPTLRYALRFGDDDWVTLCFDGEFKLLYGMTNTGEPSGDTPWRIARTEPIAKGLDTYFADLFAEE